MEEEIARFMLKASKFEFFVINQSIELALSKEVRTFAAVSGVNWTKLAQRIEEKFPFTSFDFSKSGFEIFAQTAPQYLVIKENNRADWDSDNDSIDSWDRLLSRGYAQLRNNVAHGNKKQKAAPFTYERTALNFCLPVSC
ncbi:hypothetical protein [Mesorhizobium sp. M1163]|uniref:hypothetical protein n=1 Tax=Mesorhizobium sp. M1163 TaxID=2957065 RepID=UPI0033364AD1